MLKGESHLSSPYNKEIVGQSSSCAHDKLSRIFNEKIILHLSNGKNQRWLAIIYAFFKYMARHLRATAV